VLSATRFGKVLIPFSIMPLDANYVLPSHDEVKEWSACDGNKGGHGGFVTTRS
jgi:hypothetical protein